MFDVILIGHGKLAIEMKNSAEMIFGKLDSFIPLTFELGEGVDDLKNKIEKIVEKGKSYLIFTDLFCGTPYNASCAFRLQNTENNIEILSGMSLPLVLEVASMRETYPLHEAISVIMENSQQVVKRFAEFEDEEDDFDED